MGDCEKERQELSVERKVESVSKIVVSKY